MRIVIVSDHFTKVTGYIENKLPPALSKLGHEVHIVTSDLQVSHNLPDYNVTYGKFQGPAVQPCGLEQCDGYLLHRLPHQMLFGYVRISGLWRYLHKLRPDIVQVFAAASWSAMEAALAQPLCGYRLFSGAHQSDCVFSPAVKASSRWSPLRIGSDIRRALPGRMVSFFSEKCYAATIDCAEIAVTYYGVPQKQIDVCPLGVDTDLFYPASRSAAASASREDSRRELGVAPGEVLCIYTGRMTIEKNPECLARAVAELRSQGEPFRALFVGNGPQSKEVATYEGCLLKDFVPARELPAFYRAADIAVWPASRSISTLDASACGLPVVVSDTEVATERFEGNGLRYELGNVASLKDALLKLRDPDLRSRLGSCGAERVATRFSWREIAQRRVADYELALSKPLATSPSSHARNQPSLGVH